MPLTAAIVAALATQCAPAVATQTLLSVARVESAFDPLAIGAPGDGPLVIDAVRSRGGSAGTVSDAEVWEAIDLLGATEGILTEPAGGTTIASLGQLAAKGKIAPDDQDLLKSADAALADGDAAMAAQLYAQLLQEDDKNVHALAGLARCYVETGALEQAKQTLDLVPEAKRGEAPVAAARVTASRAAG